MEPAVSRRSFLQATTLSCLLVGLTSCGDPEGNGSDDPTSPTPATIDEVVDNALADLSEDAEDLFGATGASLVRSRVTEPTYLDLIAQRAAEFTVGESAAPLQLDSMAPIIDAGAAWANSLLLVGVLDAASNQRILRMLRDQGTNIGRGLAAFGYSRTLDVAASNANGVPLLAHTSQVIYWPDIDVQIPETPSPESPSPTFDPPQFLYVLDSSGIVEIDLTVIDPLPAEAFDVPRGDAALAMISDLAGTNESGRVEYLPISEERAPALNLNPANYGWETSAVIYTEPVLAPARAQASGPTSRPDALGAPIPSEQPDPSRATAVKTAGLDVSGPPSVEITEQPPGHTWGPGVMMPPFPFGLWRLTCEDSPSIDACEECARDNLFGGIAAIGATISFCVGACFLKGIICLVGYPLCVAACVGACAAIAASMTYILISGYIAVRKACRMTSG